ncbi:MAG: hypothetical protein K9N35_11395 [Candidatus Marinimicrobia bacterium]|nr:hypothetical protein [Candidatus Neomarinimicrobiota bacterium]
MRYLLLFLLAYYIFRTVRRLLSNLKIRIANSEEVKNGVAEPHSRLQVDEADIEDAEFKDLD